MRTTANSYAIQQADGEWLIGRLRPKAGQRTRFSWQHLTGLLESRGERLFDGAHIGEALRDVWYYLDVICDLRVSQLANVSLATELAALGYRGIHVISCDVAVRLSAQLANIWIDEKEMRLLLTEVYQTDQRCDVAAETAALFLLQEVLKSIRSDQLALLWFAEAG